MKGKDLADIIHDNKLSQIDAARKMNISRGTLINWINRENLSPEQEKTVLAIFPIEKKDNNFVPLLDVVATGSSELVEVDQDPSSRPIGYVDVGGLMPKAEYLIRVSGNSMTPNYPSGCLIGIRKIEDGYFDYGSVYVIETRDNRFIKRVYKGKKDDHIQLYSDNDSKFIDGPKAGEYCYEPFQMPIKDIKRIFKVVGAAKSNDHSFIP